MLEGDREDLCLYLFKTHARNKMLAFRRLVGPEFPMRLLPLDYLEECKNSKGGYIEHNI